MKKRRQQGFATSAPAGPQAAKPSTAGVLVLITATTGLTYAGPSAAQAPRTDGQVWASLSGTIPAGRSAEIRVDGLVQFVDGASRNGRELVRGVVLKHMGRHVKMGGGYVWTEFAPRGAPRLTEHRTVQEVDVQTPILGGRAVFASRTQVEQRWREDAKGMSLRLRQRSRLQAPIGSGGEGVVVWNEYFHEFRDTPWSGPAGPGLMISFAGVHLPLTDAVAIEPGYVNQTEFNRGPNRVRHAAAIFASVRF